MPANAGRTGFLIGLIVGCAIGALAWFLGADAEEPSQDPLTHSAQGPRSDVRSATPLVDAIGPGLGNAVAGPTLPADVTPAEAKFLSDALAEERRRREAAIVRPEDGGLDVFRRIVVERGEGRNTSALFDTESGKLHRPPATWR